MPEYPRHKPIPLAEGDSLIVARRRKGGRPTYKLVIQAGTSAMILNDLGLIGESESDAPDIRIYKAASG